MKKISFTLQDAPDFWTSFDADLPLGENGDCTVSEETALAILLNNKFPQLRKCHRRIKNLVVVDETGKTYATDDFDIPESLTKK
mgnify:CR=1 FL=1